MKRLPAVLGALLLILTLPGTTWAGRATHLSGAGVTIWCDALNASNGPAVAYFEAALSADGADAMLEYWTRGDLSQFPNRSRDWERTPELQWDGSVLSGRIPLVRRNGDPAGWAAFEAILSPVGAPMAYDDRYRDGNYWERYSGTDQVLDPTGTLMVAGSAFSLDGCFADSWTQRVFVTNPTAYVDNFTSRGLACELVNADGDVAYLWTALERREAYVDVEAYSHDGRWLGAYGQVPFRGDRLDAALAAYDYDSGEAGAASIQMAIVGRGDPIDETLRVRDYREAYRGQALDFEGSLAIGGMRFDLGGCVGFDVRGKVIATSPNGPRPGGHVPPNDKPRGARLLADGDRVALWTKGASPAPERPVRCGADVGFTVWYAIDGDGTRVTVDTAGSLFDTVAAVYVRNGTGRLVPVRGACVDDPQDSWSYQSRVTWKTAAGTRYWVQVGGFGGQFGKLRLTVR